MALYRPRLRSSGLLCGMRAAPPQCAFVSLALRLGFIAALCKYGDPELRRSVRSEVAAHRAAAACSGEKVSTCDDCRGRAPRIETTPCDELSDSGDSLLLKLMRHNDEAERAAR
jgi:hypothetical protein